MEVLLGKEGRENEKQQKSNTSDDVKVCSCFQPLTEGIQTEMKRLMNRTRKTMKPNKTEKNRTHTQAAGDCSRVDFCLHVSREREGEGRGGVVGRRV